jgi:probable rRNA maturation factor
MDFPNLPETVKGGIAFYVEDVASPLLEENLWREWLSASADYEERTIESLSYIFCSDDYLLDMNREYLDHDYYTDVITFPHAAPGEVVHGDVFVSVDRVREHAKELDISFERELARVMVHGLLHLVGYKDDTENDTLLMRQREDKHLSRLYLGVH